MARPLAASALPVALILGLNLLLQASKQASMHCWSEMKFRSAPLVRLKESNAVASRFRNSPKHIVVQIDDDDDD